MMATTRPPRPDADLPARTVEWLAEHPHQRRFVHSVWDELAELERVGYHTGAIDALRSVLLDHQPATRAGRCRACRRFTWRHRPILWRYHHLPLPWCRRRFPCIVWFQIGGALLEQVAERGRHRAPGRRSTGARSPPAQSGGRPPAPARLSRAAPQANGGRPMAGRHSRRGRLTGWRRSQGDAARDRSRSRLARVTDAGTLIEHLMTGQAATDGHGRYVALCGARVLPASLIPPGGFCPLCAGAP